MTGRARRKNVVGGMLKNAVNSHGKWARQHDKAMGAISVLPRSKTSLYGFRMRLNGTRERMSLSVYSLYIMLVTLASGLLKTPTILLETISKYFLN